VGACRTSPHSGGLPASPIQLTNDPASFGTAAPDPRRNHKLWALGVQPAGEFVKYDLGSKRLISFFLGSQAPIWTSRATENGWRTSPFPKVLSGGADKTATDSRALGHLGARCRCATGSFQKPRHWWRFIPKINTTYLHGCKSSSALLRKARGCPAFHSCCQFAAVR
jgi:hypothetical protein